MAENGLHIGAQMVLAVVLLVVFGTLYNLGIQRVPWLAHRRSAEQVVGGVLVTVTTCGFFIGWTNALLVLVFFAAAGLPMLIGSWVRAYKDDRMMVDELKKIAREHIK